MIQHISHVYRNLDALRDEITSPPLTEAGSGACAILVQVFSAEVDPEHIQAIAGLIAEQLPSAVIVGATSVGEIAHGHSMANHTVIGFTFFETSRIDVVTITCKDGDERAAGAHMGQQAAECSTQAAGMLLLAASLNINMTAFLQGMQSVACDIPTFGGGAGYYSDIHSTLVLSGTQALVKGVVAVVLSGPDLHINCSTYLGWRPLSRRMTITGTEGNYITSIDGRPAFDIYRRYLSVDNDSQFYLNALEFPFLVERDGQLMARVPVTAREDGALQMVADIHEGEVVRLGYGDLDLIIDNARQIHDRMAQSMPQAMFLYACGCRRFLMQEDAELETLPYESLAPAFGFYTYGEFFGSTRLNVYNATMVAVSLREGDADAAELAKSGKADGRSEAGSDDPYANKHLRVVSRLLRFIDAVAQELEAANQEVTKLSVTDGLTQLANRMRLDQVLDEQVELARRYGTPFSVILIDVDHFKTVNDKHGHLVGDQVLVAIARTLDGMAREVDVVGRWGGEEFLVIVPNQGIQGAARLAEKLRAGTESCEVAGVGRQTCSFGVAQFITTDQPAKLVARADEALYAAKRAGRNRVELGRSS